MAYIDYKPITCNELQDSDYGQLITSPRKTSRYIIDSSISVLGMIIEDIRAIHYKSGWLCSIEIEQEKDSYWVKIIITWEEAVSLRAYMLISDLLLELGAKWYPVGWFNTWTTPNIASDKQKTRWKNIKYIVVDEWINLPRPKKKNFSL